MKAMKWMRVTLQTIARALDPENMKRLFLKILSDLRTAVSESTSATGRFFLSIPLGLLCLLLYGAKAIKWFFRIFHKLGSITLAEIAYHTDFLACTSTRLRERWSELVDGLLGRAARLWDEVLGAETVEKDKYHGRLWKLAWKAVICTGCWVPRLLEAMLAVGWAVVAAGGLVFVLVFRRSHPIEIMGAVLLTLVPPLLQHEARRLLPAGARGVPEGIGGGAGDFEGE